jgi:hypothetical protein
LIAIITKTSNNRLQCATSLSIGNERFFKDYRDAVPLV